MLALTSVGYWLHGAVQKDLEERETVERLRDTTGDLRRALAPAPPASLVAQIDARLKAAQAPRDPALVEAAEVYIVSAREIARRRVEAARLERSATANRVALEAHLGRARNDAWFRDALALKKRVEHDHFDLDVALKALDELLRGLPEAEQALAPRVAPEVLLDEGEREKARRAAQLEAKRAGAALERVRALAVR